MLICYPIKYKDKLYGLLYAGDPVRPELTEEQADMGMLVAHQLAASMYHMESEALYERQRKRHDTYKEIVKGFWLLRIRRITCSCSSSFSSSS